MNYVNRNKYCELQTELEMMKVRMSNIENMVIKHIVELKMIKDDQSEIKSLNKSLSKSMTNLESVMADDT